MLVWDTKPIMKCAAEVSAKAKQIDAAIDWDELLTEKKDALKEAKGYLSCRISLAQLKAEGGGLVGHSVDIEGNIDKLCKAQKVYLDMVRKIFPYQDVLNTKLFDILYDEEWRKEEAERQKQIEMQKRLEKEALDKRYKCCKNGHCYGNMAFSCPWCGETNVLERVDENTLIESIDLYVGHLYGRWVLTTDPNVEGKGQSIRKITVDKVGKYKLYYHLDGQNPNPFCNNNIKLGVGERIMKGSRLVELCDKLIDGGLNKLLL